MFYKVGLVLIASATLAACSPRSFETEPVEVETPAGVVTCQLYTRALTDWDRSISRPDSMSVATADSYCRQEGQARQSGS